jgi:uncharacterized protein YodC (DUF2158 family)
MTPHQQTVRRRTAVSHHCGARRGAQDSGREKFVMAQPQNGAGFTVGQLVQLKSGGSPMTVNYVGTVVFAPGIWLICQWFNAAGELCQEMFHEDMVEPVPGIAD